MTLAHRCQIVKDKKYIILNTEEKLNFEHLRFFKTLIKERSNRKPIAYLINKKFFWKYEFLITEDTLIPRHDTELLIELALKITKNKNRINVLDIGIGSGCILLSILKKKKNFIGKAIDIITT